MVHSLFDGLVQSKCLVSTCDEDHHLGIRKQDGDKEVQTSNSSPPTPNW
jgi:hypothetical protein